MTELVLVPDMCILNFASIWWMVRGVAIAAFEKMRRRKVTRKGWRKSRLLAMVGALMAIITAHQVRDTTGWPLEFCFLIGIAAPVVLGRIGHWIYRRRRSLVSP